PIAPALGLSTTEGAWRSAFSPGSPLDAGCLAVAFVQHRACHQRKRGRTMTAELNLACPGANAALALLQRLADGGWTRLGVPGFDAALTRSQLGETYDLVFAFRLGEDHHFDAPRAAKQLLDWLQAHRPWRTTALLAVVFGSAHVIDIERITP